MKAREAPGSAPRMPRFQTTLSLQLMLVLSIAILPLGIIALIQTTRLQAELDQIHPVTLQLLTAELAQREREAIREALGTAQTVATFAAELTDGQRECSELMQRVVENSDGLLVFAGLLPPSGVMTCSSSQRTFDFSGFPMFASFMANPRITYEINEAAPLSTQSVVIVSVPFNGADGTFAGYVSVSLPHTLFRGVETPEISGAPAILAVLKGSGTALTASIDLDDARAIRVDGLTLSDLVRDRSPDFVGTLPDGRTASVSSVPIIDGELYAVGVWEEEVDPNGVLGRIAEWPPLFPLLMWVTSLAIIAFSVNRLMVKPTRRLGRQMRRFAANREPAPAAPPQLSKELAVIDAEFRSMSARIVEDEEQIRSTVHEKDVLLKELHHRIKNNLQLISSIVNMQERQTRDPGAVVALNGINRRIASMATVHRHLYDAGNLSNVMADTLLPPVIHPLFDLAPRTQTGALADVSMHVDQIQLYPDQALPLALLSVEAVTNALKHSGSAKCEPISVRYTLQRTGDDVVELIVVNSMDPSRDVSGDPDGPPRFGSSLGGRLIRSFARQLNAKLSMHETATTYELTASFKAMPFSPDEPAAFDHLTEDASQLD